MRSKLDGHRALLAGPFGKSLLRSIKESVAPIFWYDPHSRQVPRNGSIFVVDTGAALVAVTAGHVYDAYLAVIAATHSVICQIGSEVEFDPRLRLIDRGAHTDLATFRITPSEFTSLQKSTVPWPPELPKIGEAVLVAGFPGLEKQLFLDTGSVEFGAFTALVRVDSITERQISWVRPNDEDMVDTLELGFPPRNYESGGMSGGPVAVLRDRSGILSWAISGVISEGGSQFEISMAARADCIQSDGTLSDSEDTRGYQEYLTLVDRVREADLARSTLSAALSSLPVIRTDGRPSEPCQVLVATAPANCPVALSTRPPLGFD